MEKQSWYDFIKSQEEKRTNVGFDYEGKIFEKTLSNPVLQGDKNRILSDFFIITVITKVRFQDLVDKCLADNPIHAITHLAPLVN